MIRVVPSLCFVLLVVCFSPCCATATELLYDNGPPNDPRTGSGLTQWIEADDFTVTEAARIDSIRFWDFERGGGFQGTVVWQIYANTDSNMPGNLIATGTSVNLSRSATGVPVFGAFQDFVNDFDITRMYLPAGTYWLGLHNGPLDNTVGSYLDVMYWDNTDGVGLRPSYSKIAPFTGPWMTNYFPPYASELAFQVNGVPAPKITACDLSDGHPQLSFISESGETYRVVYKNNLTDVAWAVLTGADSIVGTGGLIQVTDPDPNARTLHTRFYRVEML